MGFLRFLLLSLGLMGLPYAMQAQLIEKLKAPINKMFGDSTTAPGEPKLVGYPTLAYAPETRWEIGASLLYVYHAKRKPENRLSELSTFAFVTLESQYGLWLDHALYTDENRWYFLGRVRAQSFPLRYHGIGTEAPAQFQAYVFANQIWWRERILRRMGEGNWFVGLDADAQSLWNVDFFWDPEVAQQVLPLGNAGSFNLGLGPSLVYDNRENVLNVRRGVYGVASGLMYRPAWGSQFSFSQFFTEVRGFYPINERQVLAGQVQGVFNDGDVPFNQLSLMGGESLMRGYYLGRYRDRQMLAAQVEYRWLPFDLPFTDRLGAAVFLGVGTVAPTVSDLIHVPWQLAGGGGLRFLIFPDKDIYTRFDVGFTREGPGYYLYIGEAF